MLAALLCLMAMILVLGAVGLWLLSEILTELRILSGAPVTVIQNQAPMFEATPHNLRAFARILDESKRRGLVT